MSRRLARHRRRRLHRLEPRARAARARRRGARARQLLDRQPRQPRRARRRGGRGRAALLRARPQRRPRGRRRLPPRRARLGAALGAGSADVERGQRRGHAQRPPRGARRGRPPRRLLVELVGLRHAPRAARDRRRRRPIRSRRTASRSSRPSATASASAASTSRSRPSCCATSTSSGRGRARSRSTRRSCRCSSPRSGGASRSRSTATASSRATSPTSRTSSTRRSAQRRRTARAAGSSTSPPARRRSVNELADTIGRILGKPVERRVRAAAARRHPRLLGRHRRSARDARLRAADRPRGRAAPARSRPAWSMSSARARPRPPRDRAAQRGRAGAARRVPLRRLTERGYDTTLVAGTIARGEESMAYVAEEAGARVDRAAGPLARDLAAARRASRSSGSPRLIRRVRPQILHTHTAKAGTVGRIAALLAGDARPPIVVHTFHGHVLRGYFGPAKTRFFRVLERLLAKVTTVLVAVSPEVRDDLVALGVAPRGEVRRRPARHRARGARPLRRAARGDPSPARHPAGALRRRLDRPDDRREADTRPARPPSPRCASAASTRACCVVGDGPDRDVFEQRAQDARPRPPLPLPRLPGGRRALLRGDGRGRPPVRERGHAGDRDRGARGRQARRRDARRRRSGRRPRGRRRLPRRARETPRRSRSGSPSWPPTPSSRDRMGAAGRERVLERYGVGRLLDDVDRLYRETMERKAEVAMGHSFSSLDELGEGYGFRKVRRGLGVTAFGVNAFVMPPRFEGFLHYHDLQDELYFVHSGTRAGRGRRRGASCSAPAASSIASRRRRAGSRTRGDDDLVVLVVGGKDGYVERDGQLVDLGEGLPRRASRSDA